MTIFQTFRSVRSFACTASLALCLLALGPWSTPAGAASTSLLAKAIHNTNTVRSLVHNDVSSITNGTYTVSITARGEEDEVANREQDYESVTVKSQKQTLHYTITIIFVNGKTYYQASQLHNQWKSRAGSTFSDPFTGGWTRARTTVTLPKDARQVGQSGGQTHFRGTMSVQGASGPVDLWVSGGATPYVVREDYVLKSPKNAHASFRDHIVFSNFNQPIDIQPPTGTSA